MIPFSWMVGDEDYESPNDVEKEANVLNKNAVMKDRRTLMNFD